MSYAVSAALQAAVYQRLLADPGVSTLVGGAVYDAVPPGEAPMTYVTLGPEDVQDASDMTGAGATHDFVVAVVTGEAGFHCAKEIAAAISDALSDAALVLERGALVALWFVRAKARRVEKGDTRRIDLTFRARVEG